MTVPIPDAALKIIGDTDADSITFDWFRRRFRGDRGVKDSLLSGHAIITDPPQLDQYLHTYGLMIESHWKNIAPLLAGGRPPVMIVDYGCGQGLAAILMHDVAPHLLSAVHHVMLIEPSDIALDRAEALYRKLAPAARVSRVCKRFDDVVEDDVPAAPAGCVLHIFSNALDVLGFDPVKLMTTTLREGNHVIVSVSHDRNFNGGTPRIEAVKAAFEHPAMATQWTIRQSLLDRFPSTNPPNSTGVVWFCELDVRDG